MELGLVYNFLHCVVTGHGSRISRRENLERATCKCGLRHVSGRVVVGVHNHSVFTQISGASTDADKTILSRLVVSLSLSLSLHVAIRQSWKRETARYSLGPAYLRLIAVSAARDRRSSGPNQPRFYFNAVVRSSSLSRRSSKLELRRDSDFHATVRLLVIRSFIHIRLLTRNVRTDSHIICDTQR